MVYPVIAPPTGLDEPFYGLDRSTIVGRVLHFENLNRRRLGEPRVQRYVRLSTYYSSQMLPPDEVEQPLQINYFKTIVDKHAAYLWGQYRDRLFDFRVTPRNTNGLTPNQKAGAIAYGRLIKVFLDQWYEDINGDLVFWEAAKNASLYGDAVLATRYDPITRMVRLESILPEYFHAMWHPTNMNQLTEVLVAYPIDRQLAKEVYGIAGNENMLGYQVINPDYLPGIGIFWQHWSTTSYQEWVDDMPRLNQPNPYMPVDTAGQLYHGMLPFVHVPNMRMGGDFFGFSDAEAVMYIIDELNRRIADIGDIVNTHAHPIVTLTNFTGKISSLNTGPDALWDMGREGKAERLEGTGPAPDVMAYIEMLKELLRETASMPSAAFGSNRGGTTHQSGQVMAMLMMPVIERAREKRLYWRSAIKQITTMLFRILHVVDPAILHEAGLSLYGIQQYTIEPVFADILPKNELEEVNKAVARVSSMLWSIPSALEELGVDDVDAEYELIQSDAQMKASLGAQLPAPDGGTAGKNSEQGMGGSASIPGGIGAGMDKPGAQISSPDIDKVDNVGLGNDAD